MTTTDRIVMDRVLESLTPDAAQYDVAAIARELVDTFGLTGDSPSVTFEDIDGPTYWGIVNKHRRETASHAYGFGILSRGVIDYLAGDLDRAGLEKCLKDITAAVDAYEKSLPNVD